MAMTNSELDFTAMRAGEVSSIGAMERLNYEFPWNEGIFRDCLKAGYICEVLRLAGDIIGYGILQVAADEAHLLNLCIDKSAQHQGFARVMLERLLYQAASRNANVVFLEVRPSNPRAIELYQRAGFNEVGLRKGYYDARNGREDALVMAFYLGNEKVRG
jgi:ribosomal-protein-alanine N-acetyltransferase